MTNLPPNEYYWGSSVQDQNYYSSASTSHCPPVNFNQPPPTYNIVPPYSPHQYESQYSNYSYSNNVDISQQYDQHFYSTNALPPTIPYTSEYNPPWTSTSQNSIPERNHTEIPRRSRSSERYKSKLYRSKERSRERYGMHKHRSHCKSHDHHKSRKRSRSRESTTRSSKLKPPTERELILEKYRRNYCETSKDMQRKMNELSSTSDNEKSIWTRTAPADLYYTRDEKNPKIMQGTHKLHELSELFKKTLLDRVASARAFQPPYEPPLRKTKARLCKHKSEACSSSSSDSDSSMDEDDRTMEELMAKKQHPQRLHPEMWFNDPGEMNDGPLCRCSAKSRRSGIRHGIYSGEGAVNKCDLNTNNADKLYHYRITISPPTNFLTKTPTIIKHDEHEFIFEGFSMLSHFPLVKLPTCKVIRFNIEYTILYLEEKLPENFTIKELNYFRKL